jgi:hypothetical protein
MPRRAAFVCYFGEKFRLAEVAVDLAVAERLEAGKQMTVENSSVPRSKSAFGMHQIVLE